MYMEEAKRIFDVVIPVKASDVGNLGVLIEQIRKHIVGARKVKIITNTSQLSSYIEDDIVEYIDENKAIENLSLKKVREFMEKSHMNVSSAGWFFQQFIKIEYSKICKDEYYLVWDADTFPTKDISFFTSQNKPIFDLKREYWWQYFDAIKMLIGLNKGVVDSYIAEHMLYNTEICKELMDVICSNESIVGDNFWEKVLSVCRDISHPRPFSEFELYGTYVENKYKNLYCKRRLQTLRPGALYFGLNPSQGLLNYVGKDFSTVSFEDTDKEGSRRPQNLTKAYAHFLPPLKAIKTTIQTFKILRNLPFRFLKDDCRRVIGRCEFDDCFNTKSLYEELHSNKVNKDEQLFFDLTGEIEYSKCSNHVSGVERVIAILCKELIKKEEKIRFIFFNGSDHKWYEIFGMKEEDFDDLSILNKIVNNRHLYRRDRDSLLDALRNKPRYKYFSVLAQYLRDRSLYKYRAHKAEICRGKNNGNIKVLPFDLSVVGYKSTLSVCHWVNVYENYEHLINCWKQRGGTVSFFYHDIIPITNPEFVSDGVYRDFYRYYNLISKYADFLITSAEYNVREFKKFYLAEMHREYSKPIFAIGLPSTKDIISKKKNSVSSSIRWIKSYPFCLCVGSIAERKNHHEILQAWRKFYVGPSYNNELLIIAGNYAGFGERIHRVANGDMFGGSVITLSNISDEDLDFLYEHCKFTLNLSLYEGWGMPVSESVAYKKPVIVLNSTTLPEAAYGLGLLTERNTSNVCKLMSMLFSDNEFYSNVLNNMTKNINKVIDVETFISSFTKIMKDNKIRRDDLNLDL